jgi:alkylated DNA repair dioxygenase AlkB
MQSLFTVEPFPPGFRYFPEFITPDEEKHLLETVTAIPLETFIFQGFEARRKSASFGYDYHFDKRRLTKGKPIPEEFNFLLDKVAAAFSLQPSEFAELLILEYPAGAVINWHRDAPPFDIIAGISLLSDCTFRLRPYDKSKRGRKSVISFPVKRRSLYIMQGEARSEWEHSTTPVKEKRYSVTLRTLRPQ